MTVGEVPDVDTRTVEATKTSFHIIQALKQLEGAGVTELANKLEISKSTVHKHLSTLRRLGYVTKTDTEYNISVRFLEVGIAAQQRLDLIKPSKQPLKKLSETTGEVANLMIAENGRGVYAYRVVPTDVKKPPIQVGEPVPLHATAGGKAILAYTKPEKRERIVNFQGIHASTDMTITDCDELDRELRDVRDTRTSYDRGEYLDGWYCIAVPITNNDDQANGAVTITGPSERMKTKISDGNMSNFIGSTANSIENKAYPS